MDLQAPPTGYPISPNLPRGTPRPPKAQGLVRSHAIARGAVSRNPGRRRASSAAQGLALRCGFCEVTSVILGKMGHKTQSPARLQGPRCGTVARRGWERRWQAIKVPATEGWEASARGRCCVTLGTLLALSEPPWPLWAKGFRSPRKAPLGLQVPALNPQALWKTVGGRPSAERKDTRASS